MVLRNPYDATLADYKRQMSGSHTGNLEKSNFENEIWRKFIDQHMHRWFGSAVWFPLFAEKSKIPMLIIYYEDMKVTDCFTSVLTFSISGKFGERNAKSGRFLSR